MKFQQVQNTNTDQRKNPSDQREKDLGRELRPGSRCYDLGRARPALLLEGLMFRQDLVVQGLMFLEGGSYFDSSTEKCFAG